MRILGVDCGAERTGYGVIDSDGRDHRLVACGVVSTRVRDPLAQRLLVLAQGLEGVLQAWSPREAAVEEVFYAANVKTALKLAHVRGVVLMLLAQAGLDCSEYAALEIKTSVVGYGRAGKSQVQKMVASLLGLREPVESEDASDALAVAICHATRAAFRSALSRPVSPARTEVAR
jgi:crossover junction endodeoxyribonuclease RuvC